MANHQLKINHSILVKDLKVSYDGQTILNHLDFKAGQGEFVSVIGKSGCGKTTLLNALADLIPYSGEISLIGKIGMIFQQYAVFSWMSVEKNIAFGLSSLSFKERQPIVQQYLKLTELEDKQKCYPGQLSGGQIQRVALARSLAPNPDILLMDEPYGALDSYTREKMQGWLLDIWSLFAKTVIFVTHNMEEAVYLGDRVVILGRTRFTQEFIIPFVRPRQEEIKFTSEFNQLKKEIQAALND